MSKKSKILGSAQWGWTIEENEVYRILDCFYSHGFREIDLAYNYPINRLSNDMGLAEKYLSRWIRNNNVNDLEIIYKVGSLDNSGASKFSLSDEHLVPTFEKSLSSLRVENVSCAMVHWDDSENIEGPQSQFLELIESNEISFGLSGINYPSKYIPLLHNLRQKHIPIQCKFNLLYDGTVPYKPLEDQFELRFLAYGIGLSGLKFSKSQYQDSSYVNVARPSDYHDKVMSSENLAKIRDFQRKCELSDNMYYIGLEYCERAPEISGYLLGPKNRSQLMQTLTFIKDRNDGSN